mgnify:CR=1 FL=1
MVVMDDPLSRAGMRDIPDSGSAHCSGNTCFLQYCQRKAHQAHRSQPRLGIRLASHCRALPPVPCYTASAQYHQYPALAWVLHRLTRLHSGR